jgi:glycosyltransferase involved in cell wall biosynthesis
MKLLINAASTKMGGALTYLIGTARALAACPGVRLTIIMPAEIQDRLRDGLRGAQVEFVLYPFRSTAGAARIYFDQVVVPRMVRAGGYDALFSATGFGTFRSPVAQLLLIPNAHYFGSYEERAGYSRAAYAIRQWWVRRSIRSADVVVFPTAALRDDVLRAIGTEVDAVVAPYGVPTPASRAENDGNRGQQILERMEGWRSAGERVLLYVSLYSPTKDFGTAIDAVARLQRAGERIRLVLTLPDGLSADPGLAPELPQLLARADALDGAVLCTGQLSHDEVARLYAGADVFLFPSLLESFGLPMIEAQAAGLPIVAADTPVNREVCGDAACFFPPGDAEACAAAVAALLEDSSGRTRMSATGRLRAAQHTWEAHAAALLNAATGAVRGRATAPATRALAFAARSDARLPTPSLVLAPAGGAALNERESLSRSRPLQFAASSGAVAASAGTSSATPAPAPASRAPVSVIIITRNEAIHIDRTVSNVRDWAEAVFVVDSFSTDDTCRIARDAGAEVVQHEFVNFALQRQWAFENLPIRTGWIFILDADELIPDALKEEISQRLQDVPEHVGAFQLRRRFYWMDRWLKRGGLYPIWTNRLVRNGRGRYGDRIVNEIMEVDGEIASLENDLLHVELTTISHWLSKHNVYSTFEAAETLRLLQEPGSGGGRLFGGTQSERTQWIRTRIWVRLLPPLIRPVPYFLYRYVFRLGFLDGVPGLVFHVLHAFCFQFLIDVKYLALKSRGSEAVNR